MARRKQNPWAQEKVIDYVIDSYGGVEESPSGRPRRMFIWADDDGEVWIGNTAAFAEHCAEVFGFQLLKYDYVMINRIMIEVGERLRDYQKREPAEGPPQAPLSPDKRRAH